MKSNRISRRNRDAIINSLRAGVTPRIGLQYIHVGRIEEIKALNEDIDSIVEGAARFRLIVGEYGSGKTFFMHLIRLIALKKNLVSAHADLTGERRIYSTGGHAKKLYSELMSNLSVPVKPDGNALTSIVEKFITNAREKADQEQTNVSKIIREQLRSLHDYPEGYDFAYVIDAYWRGHESGNDKLMTDAIRWLKAEYNTKTEARQDLGVRKIISDDNFYDSLKLMGVFVRKAGFKGILFQLDEMVNLYKLNSSKARNKNYEQILRILNDCLQGSAEHIGFLMGVTPELLKDERKGLFSYEALRSRLAMNTLAKKQNLIDYNAPVLELDQLTKQELVVLLANLRHVYASCDKEKYLVPDEAFKVFLEHCFKVIGANYYQTTRNIIKGFLDMLSLLDQNTELDWKDLISSLKFGRDAPATNMNINIPKDTSSVEYKDLNEFKI